jgi:PAS domain S-box-containing protein
MIPCPRNESGCVDVEGCPLRLECLTRLLAEREEQFLTFWRVSLDFHCIIAESGVFERVSDASASMFGYTPAQMEGHPFVEFLHPDDVVPSLGVSRDLFRNHSPVVAFRNRYRHANGHYVPVSWNVSPPVNGHIYGTARVVADKPVSVTRILESVEAAEPNGVRVASRSSAGRARTA